MRKIEISADAVRHYENTAVNGFWQDFFRNYSYLYNDIESDIDIISVKELKPLDSHKSFYKKAYIKKGYFHYKSNRIMYFNMLVSYETIICGFFTFYEIDMETGELIEIQSEFIPLYYGGYELERNYPMYGIWIDYNDDISATTARHILAYCGLSKNEFKNAFNLYWEKFQVIDNVILRQ